jgi:hypothetical protein
MAGSFCLTNTIQKITAETWRLALQLSMNQLPPIEVASNLVIDTA